MLGHRRGQHDAFRARIADARQQVAGRFFGDGDIDIDLVRRAGDRRRLDVDILEKAEPLDAYLRTVDSRSVIPRAFELTELAPYNFVARFWIAGNVDLANVRATAWVDEERERRGRLVAIELRYGVDVGKHFARLDTYERGKFGLGHHQIASDLHIAHRKERAFGDIERDENILAIRRDRHLRRLDVELEIAAVLVVAAKHFEVGRKLLLRILVVLRVPREPARRGQGDFVQQLLFGERFRADDVDSGDLRGVAFLYGEVEGDTVAFLRRHRCLYLCAIKSARDVLPLQLLLRAVERGTVEDPRFRNADVFQRFLDRVGIELLVADERQ